MRILVACEESQAVTIELRKLGHEAYSCDIEPCSGGHPEWHIKGDTLLLLNGHISFCTADGTLHTSLLHGSDSKPLTFMEKWIEQNPGKKCDPRDDYCVGDQFGIEQMPVWCGDDADCWACWEREMGLISLIVD